MRHDPELSDRVTDYVLACGDAARLDHLAGAFPDREPDAWRARCLARRAHYLLREALARLEERTGALWLDFAMDAIKPHVAEAVALSVAEAKRRIALIEKTPSTRAA